MKRAMFLATAALLAMLFLAPMAWAQGGTTVDLNPCQPGEPLSTTGECHQGSDVGPAITIINGKTYIPSASPAPVPPSGGPALVLPAAVLLLGSGILTYAILRRR
jgi:hypothetical protein